MAMVDGCKMERASQGPDGSYDLKDSHDFKYQALSKELHVGNVHLRVYQGLYKMKVLYYQFSNNSSHFILIIRPHLSFSFIALPFLFLCE